MNWSRHCHTGRTDDSVLCPVLQFARLVNRIWTYAGVSLDTQVCTVWRNGCMEHITSIVILQHLRSACGSYGNARLGPHEVGTPSLRSGAGWRCILGKSPSTPSCSSAGGQATLFFATSKNRWSNSCATLWRRCWPFRHLVISRTSLHDGFLRKIPGSATIEIMPRRGEILDATNHDRRSYLPSPCTPNRQTGRCNIINGGASISNCQRHRRGSSEGKERVELKINLSIPNPNHQCTSFALLCLILFWRGVWLQSCFVDWMQTEEQVSGKAGAKKC